MPPARGPNKIATSCPHCGKRFAVAAEHVGKQARCAACAQAFVIAAAEAATRAAAGPVGSAGAAPGAAGVAEGLLCVICQSPLAAGERTTTCPDCGGGFHEDCWQYNQGCGVYGCSQAPPTEGLSSLEIPPSYWGREEKPCPNCRQTIVAAAVRCRHCGAVFSSATPLGAGTYSAQERTKAKLPAVRKAGIWLLVFSLIPCTAPLAAVIGPFWYMKNRQTVRALPALNAALCKIAVGVALAQTGLLIICGLLASIAGG